VVGNYVLCDLGACSVKFGYTVRGVSNEKDLAVAETVKHFLEGSSALVNVGEVRDIGLEQLNCGV